MNNNNGQRHPQLDKRKRFASADYNVAIFVPLPIELAPFQAMLDTIHDCADLTTNRDHNSYILGSLGHHNVVIATIPSVGNNCSATVAIQLLNDFPSTRFALLVGIAGGVPHNARNIDVRLGDVVVSEPHGDSGGVVQFDMGKRHDGDQFEFTGHLNKPSALLVTTMKKLQAQHMQSGHQLQINVADMIRKYPEMKHIFEHPGAGNDHLYQSDYKHVGGGTCQVCAVDKTIKRSQRRNNQNMIHYGTIGSSNAVIRSAALRDELGRNRGVLALEMEAAGIMDVIPCLVIRGICDYADSHKNKIWQPYAAASAAAYAKELLLAVPVRKHETRIDPSTCHDTSHSVSEDNAAGLRWNPNPVLENPSEQLDILLKSLTFTRMDARLRNVDDAHTATCEWLFRHDHFHSWIERHSINTHNGFLWIKGKPGCGKSTIMKSALIWMRREWQAETTLSYFFNARASNGLERSSLGFYRSLTHQLLNAYQYLRDSFRQQFQFKEKNGVVEEWTISELKNFILSCINDLQGRPLNVFVDALDEGEENDVRQMIAFLEDLSIVAHSSSSLLRICLSSRYFPQISIKRGLLLEMEQQPGHGNDIKTFIRTKLIDDGSTEMGQLRETIFERSRSIFLWVILVVPMLNRAHDKGSGIRSMTQYLEDTPDELDDLFERILNQSDDRMQECVSLFQWILFSRHTLTPLQLELAIRSSSLDQRFDEDQRSEDQLRRYLLDTSRGLTEITESDPPTVQFIHETVREFLQRKGLAQIDISLARNIEGLSHEKLKLGYLRYVRTYWSSITDKLPKTRQRRQVYQAQVRRKMPLIEYAASGLLIHANLAERHEVSQQEFLRQLGADDGAVLKLWVRVRNCFQNAVANLYSDNLNLLYAIVDQKLEELVKVLLRDHAGIDINEKGERFGTALQAASAAGLEATVRLLIDAGAQVNADGGEFGHALLAAMHHKQESVMRLLVQRGAKPDSDALKHALFKNISRGYSTGVELLLDLGASVDQKDQRSRSPLCAALAQGRSHIVKILIGKGANDFATAFDLVCKLGLYHMAVLLIDWGADIDTLDEFYGSALQAACYNGERDIMHLLIDHGANINLQGGDYGTALQAAVVYGDEEIVQYLIKQGADVNMEGGYYGCALQAAAYHGPEMLVRLLIDHGADVNIQSGEYGSVLQAACCSSKEDILRLLIDYGADVNLRGGRYSTALQAAATLCDKEILCLLLDRGADINIQCGHYGSVLHAACYGDREDNVRLLIDYGADVNLKGGKYGTALQAAVIRENKENVRLLLDRGADVNFQGGYYGSALHAACYIDGKDYHNVREDIVHLLMDYGAEINLQDGKLGTVLQTAVFCGNKETVRLLLDRGADVDFHGGPHGSALHAAVFLNREQILHLLIEYGVDLTWRAPRFGSALEAAQARKLSRIEKILVDALARSAAA